MVYLHDPRNSKKIKIKNKTKFGVVEGGSYLGIPNIGKTPGLSLFVL